MGSYEAPPIFSPMVGVDVSLTIHAANQASADAQALHCVQNVPEADWGEYGVICADWDDPDAPLHNLNP